MTSNPAHDSNKTLQIALVGVRPADQVMLKGYMRVILRLDTGLEWVSANHPSVDFYIVNYEFAQADSVQKLLAAQPNAAVLYVQRDEANSGMVNNVLTLPLKELDQLKNWLTFHIDSLRNNQHATTDSQPLSDIQAQTNALPTSSTTTNTQSRMTLDEIIASRAKNTTATQPNSFNAAHTTISQNPNLTQSISSSEESLLTLFRELHTIDNKLLNLTKNGELIAYVHPIRQRIWLVKDIAVITPELKVVVNENMPVLENQASDDLVQWLWAKTFDMPIADITHLVRSQVPFHIMSWVKPHNVENSHEVLKIQCVLEAREATLDQVMQIAQTPRDITLRTIAALIAAGVMPPTVYTQLKTAPPLNMPRESAPMHTPTISTQPTPNITAAPNQNHTSTASTSAGVPEKADDGMKGFLSKLRRKLGL